MLKNLSGLFAGILLLFISLPGEIQAAQATMLDRVLVVVNDDIITLSELNERVQDLNLPVKKSLRKNY